MHYALYVCWLCGILWLNFAAAAILFFLFPFTDLALWDQRAQGAQGAPACGDPAMSPVWITFFALVESLDALAGHWTGTLFDGNKPGQVMSNNCSLDLHDDGTGVFHWPYTDRVSLDQILADKTYWYGSRNDGTSSHGNMQCSLLSDGTGSVFCSFYSSDCGWSEGCDYYFKGQTASNATLLV